MTDYPPSIVRRALQGFGVVFIRGPETEVPADWYSHGPTEKIAALPQMRDGGLYTPSTLASFCRCLGTCGADDLNPDRLQKRCADVHARDLNQAPRSGELAGC